MTEKEDKIDKEFIDQVVKGEKDVFDKERMKSELEYVRKVFAGEEELKPSHIEQASKDYLKRAQEAFDQEEWGWGMHCLVHYFIGDYAIRNFPNA